MMQSLSNIVHALQGLCYLPQWYLQHWHKRDKNLWTFDAWSGKRYSDNPRALYEYVLANEPSIKAVWITNSKQVYDRLKTEGKPVAMRHSKEGRRIQKDAGYFFCTHGRLCDESEGELRYMNGIRYINVWHGAPLKQVGDDEMQFKVKKQSLWKRCKTNIRKVIVPWEFISDTMLCSGPFFEPFFYSAYGRTVKHFIILPEIRLDALCSNRVENLILELNKTYQSPIKILYMPTFRDSKFGNFNPFEKVGYNQERLEKVLEENNMVFLYKGHFLDSANGASVRSKRIRVIRDNDYDDLYTFIKDVDVLITDYSSIYFDFLCLGKPMILFPFDYEEYTKQSRAFYFDYNLMEAKRVYSWQELEDCLQAKSYYPPSETEIKRFRPQSIGHCCEQLVHILKEN